MKKFFLALIFVAASVAIYANPICYFTYGQARRTVHFLNTQDELVIYCGHTYELETYVIVSDVWMERVSSRYYEIWLYGIDAYTGDELYMPIDLSCIWLLDRWTNSMYNAARYLHFQIDAPFTTLVWTMPAYTGFVRVAHPAYYHRSYHYDIHRHGWRPAPEVGLPVYYMRPPTAPMPVIANPYVPGRERPVVQVNNTLPSRPQPTTSRTTSTPVRNVNPTPTNNNHGGNRPSADPAVNGGGNSHDTRTSGTSDRNTSSSNSGGTTGRTPSTSTNNNMNPTPTPGTNTGRTPSTSNTRPTTTPTSTTTPSRTTTSQPRTSSEKPSTTTTTPNRNTNSQRTTSTNTRPSNTTTKTTSTSTNNRNTSTSTSGSRNTNNTNNGKATSTTTRTSSSSRR